MTHLVPLPPPAAGRRPRRPALRAALLLGAALLPLAAAAQTAPEPAARLEARDAPPPLEADALEARLQAGMAGHADAFAREVERVERARQALVACRADARRGPDDVRPAALRDCHAAQAALNEDALALMAEEAGAIVDTLADAADGHRALAGRARAEAADLAREIDAVRRDAERVAEDIRRRRDALEAGEPLDEHQAARLHEAWTHLRARLASLDRRRDWAAAGADDQDARAEALVLAGRDLDFLALRLDNAAEAERWYQDELEMAARHEAAVDQASAVLAEAGDVAGRVAVVLGALRDGRRDAPRPDAPRPGAVPDAPRVAPADRDALEAFIRGFPDEAPPLDAPAADLDEDPAFAAARPEIPR